MVVNSEALWGVGQRGQGRKSLELLSLLLFASIKASRKRVSALATSHVTPAMTLALRPGGLEAARLVGLSGMLRYLCLRRQGRATGGNVEDKQLQIKP